MQVNRPQFLSKDFSRPDRRRTLGMRREKVRRARGEGAKPLAAWAARCGGKRRAAPRERPPKLLTARPEHGECSPHTATSACSAPPSPQQDWTELVNLYKRSPPPACVRAEIRHRRDGKQSQINKGNRFRKDRCNRLKSLKVTPTAPEGAYRYREV